MAMLALTLACNAQVYDKDLPKCVLETESDEEFKNSSQDLAGLKAGGEIGIYMSFKFGKFHGTPYGKFISEQGLTEEDFYRHYVDKMQEKFVSAANGKLSETSLRLVGNKVVRYMLKIEYENFDSDGEHKAYYILIDTETGKAIHQLHFHTGDGKNSIVKSGKEYASKLKSALAKVK